MDKENVKKGLAAVMLLTTLLTGCSAKSNIKGKDTNNSDYIRVAIILNDNTATIMEAGYYHIEGGYAFFEYPDGSRIATSNAIIMEGFGDYSEVEAFARSMVGEDGEINYYNYNNSHVKTKKLA